MANELDKFVLQYVVDQREALKRLEQLGQKVEGVNKQSKNARAEFKEFATGAADEIGKLVPGIDKAASAIRLLGAEFAIAGAAVGALAIGVKAVMAMREQYNRQRKEGMDIGVSSLRLEEYQRKFVKASGGNISREQTAENVKRLSEFSSAVFRDPTRIGQEARTARVLGLNMGAPGTRIDVNSFMTQLGEKFSKMSEAQVQASAKTLGLSQDFALGLKKQGATVGEITELKPEEITNRKNAQKQLDDFNSAFARLSENFKEGENILGEKLMPKFTKFVAAMATLSERIPKTVGSIADTIGNTIDHMVDTAKDFAGIRRKEERPEVKAALSAAKSAATSAGSAAAGSKDNEKTAKSLKEMVDGNYDENAEAKAIADQQALAINQFAGAVASFANAVDEKQAWAAWAGEIGKASGLGAPKGGESPKREPMQQGGEGLIPVGKTQYDEFFKEAGSKYGIDPSVLKNIGKVESEFNKNVVSHQGAAGIMQIMPDNFKSLGITSPFDPRQNIMGGAKLLADYLRRSKGDLTQALMMYHGGLDKTGWGPLTRAYPGKVLGAGQAVSGESREKLNIRSVQNTIAQRLGIPVGQLQLGGVNRGDVEFASSQLQSGISNHIFDLKNQLKAVNLPQQTRSKLMTELREQQTGLTMMRKFSGDIAERAQPGERSITIGERAIIINVNGAEDPAATASAIRSHLDEHLGELVNGTSTGMKY